MARPAPLPEIRFDNPRLARVGVEVLTLAQLRAAAAREVLETTQRVDFLHVLLVQAGRLSHTIDFMQHRAAAGDVLVVRPGQVQRWDWPPAATGTLLIAAPEALVDAGIADWKAVGKPSKALFADALADARRLRDDIEGFDGGDVGAAIIRHGLSAWLLRLSRALAGAGAPAGREAQVHRLFMKELEAHHASRWTAVDYARRLGYSESTLARACLAATGHTPKELMDRRVALEAKRLLAHTDAPAAHIGHQLGFTEATNFAKFFRRITGETAQGFRERLSPRP